MSQAAFERLCRFWGIEPEYADIWGHAHHVPAATRRGLLAAMGVASGTARRDEEALRQWRRLTCGPALPPVHVARLGVPCELNVSVPWARRGLRHAWELVLEDGSRMAGAFRPDESDAMSSCVAGHRKFATCVLSLPPIATPGYHRLHLTAEGEGETPASMPLIVVPERCYLPEAIRDGRRVWGFSLQLYALRTERNWGIGDFTDLAAMVAFCAGKGADILVVNPLHALFPHDPSHDSPYSPSSRTCLNPLYLDVESIADFDECEAARERVAHPEFQARLRALRSSETVRYEEVWAAKAEILEYLYAHFHRRHLGGGSERGLAFRRFLAEQGESLRAQGVFEALQEHFQRLDAALWGWTTWPAPFRDPESAETTRFEAEHADRVAFYQYLQWQSFLQLEQVGRRSLELGLGVGMCQDLAVGADRGGAEVWSGQRLFALDASIGAPPDDFNPSGQDWGLPPYIPDALTRTAYAPFIAMLRQNMRHAGALRIDHIMGLMRLFWRPRGAAKGEGGYVSYPLDDLMGIVALESERNRCAVVGEDLGTVPEAVRDAMRRLDILSYRLLYFEQRPDFSFKPPEEYPARALVAVGTHDLPTLSGYWLGSDLDARASLGLYPDDDARQHQMVARARDRASLLVALERGDLLPPDIGANPLAVPAMSPELALAVHRYLARAPSGIMTVQIEDVLGQTEQANMPGTVGAYPNWRRKLALNLEQWEGDERFAALAAALGQERHPASRARGLAEAPGDAQARIPVATYRLQFNRDFTFAQAADIVPYLDELGVDHCYASPYLKARAGSRHGYDIIDHAALNPEIGTESEHQRFVDALHRHGMGHIIDVVPNHMAVMGEDNAWWLDVMENGQASAYAGYFDIDWAPIHDDGGKILVPVLGDHYGSVLDNGDLRLAFDAPRGEFSVRYFHHRFPVDPAEYPRILATGLDTLEARLDGEGPLAAAFRTLVSAFGRLPARDSSDAAAIAERNRDKEVYKRQLAALCAQSPDLAWYVTEAVAVLNGAPGDDGSFDALHRLLEAQAYRLAYWRVASDEINYRRFFDVNELAGIRVEEPAAFRATHRLILDLVKEGKADGLRIDHPDGLHDPRGYFARLRGETACYLVVEKILSGDERLPPDWPVHGTTGYDFANLVNGLLVQAAAAGRMARTYANFVGERQDYADLAYQSRRLIMKSAMASELNVLAHQLGRIAQSRRRTRDYTINNLRGALTEVIACFPVYRTYISDGGASDEDRRTIDIAIEAAKKKSLGADAGVFDFVREALLTTLAVGADETYRRDVLAFAMKFQQYTSPVMAKGIEDTGFYLYHRLCSLNDVGGDPARFGASLERFHRANEARCRDWPHAMLATSTHDSKRSEDVRARLDVLSELSAEWRQHLARWSRSNRGKKTPVDGIPCPSRNDEYLLYQTLIGAWPLEAMDGEAHAAFRERIAQYMLKAVREGKRQSSWINPDAAYEEGLLRFVRGLLDVARRNRFLDDFLPFQRRVSRFGMLNSLTQTLLKLTAPGVPDIYQGNELWTFSLVDPDNRRAVDYARRAHMLRELKARDGDADLAASLAASMADGRIKLFLTWKTLTLRRRYAALFRDGGYVPLRADGDRAEHICAFARVWQGQAVIVVAPRWFTDLSRDGEAPTADAWNGCLLETPGYPPGTTWRNEFTGERCCSVSRQGRAVLELATVLRCFPYGVCIVDPTFWTII